jgi:hypothetical protein
MVVPVVVPLVVDVPVVPDVVPDVVVPEVVVGGQPQQLSPICRRSCPSAQTPPRQKVAEQSAGQVGRS